MNPYRNEVKGGYRASGDQELVQAAKDGVQAAYAELAARYSPRVFSLLIRITKNAEDAEDALQETLMKAFVHLGSFDRRSSFNTWLTSIAINTALMVLRRRRRKVEVSLDAGAESGEGLWIQLVDPTRNPESTYLEQERKILLRQTIDQLPPHLRECITIQHACDATAQQIAEAMGISITATKTRLLRARRLVASAMAERPTRSSCESTGGAASRTDG